MTVSESADVKVQNVCLGKWALHVPLLVNAEWLQHYIPPERNLFQVYPVEVGYNVTVGSE
jgi:hypothetical protein